MIPRKGCMVTCWMTPAQSSVWWRKRRMMGDWCSCVPVQVKSAMMFLFFLQVSLIIFILGLCLACDIKSDIESNGPWNCLLWRKTSRWLEAFWPLLRLQNLSLSFVLSGHISFCPAMFLLKQFRYSSQHMTLESHLNNKNKVLQIVSVTHPNSTSYRTQNI